jgi:hypothetical protein
VQYPFPDELPETSRRTILAEEIRGTRELEKAKKESGVSKLRELLIGFILRVFIVFAREASKLVHQGIWTAGRLESESLEFLRQYTITARYEKGYDKRGSQIGEMVSNWGDILPDVERAFRNSPLWQEYEDILLDVAVAPVASLAIQAVEGGVWKDIEISFISDERVQVKVGTQVQTLNYTEMGFQDRRSGKPNQAWGLLRGLAQGDGISPNFARNTKDFIRLEKCMERMRQRLRKHFQIASDPVLKDPARGYSCRFKVGCGPSFER